MTKNLEIKDIPLDDIVISKEQLHIGHVDEVINELASGASETTFIQPIVVCPADEQDKYVLLTGTCNFLAHKKLNKKTIKAIVYRKLNKKEIRMVQSLESPKGKKLSIEEYARLCSWRYKECGSIEALVMEIGLSKDEVSATIDIESLEPELKKLVKDGEVDLEIALFAHAAFHKISGE
jgi:ParB/RepB/Spo0J family partition protein